MPAKILIIDDEPQMVEVIKAYVVLNKYTALTAYNGVDAIHLFEQENPDLVVLDLMLPDISGEDVCKKIRETSTVPIIMLTAKITVENKVNGLNIGADDYMIKPFSPKELIARINAVLRRTSKVSNVEPTEIAFNNRDLVICASDMSVYKQGVLVPFTPNEFDILHAMVKYPKKIFTRDELISLVLTDDFDGFDRVIDTHIKNIRKKIESDPKNYQYILTVHGVGYKFGEEKEKI